MFIFCLVSCKQKHKKMLELISLWGHRPIRYWQYLNRLNSISYEKQNIHLHWNGFIILIEYRWTVIEFELSYMWNVVIDLLTYQWWVTCLWTDFIYKFLYRFQFIASMSQIVKLNPYQFCMNTFVCSVQWKNTVHPVKCYREIDTIWMPSNWFDAQQMLPTIFVKRRNMYGCNGHNSIFQIN